MSCRLTEVEQLSIENSVLHELVLNLNGKLKASEREVVRLQYADCLIHAVAGGGDKFVGCKSMDVKTRR